MSWLTEHERVVAQVLEVLERAGLEVVHADHAVALPSRCSQRWEPRNPAPPVTTAVGMESHGNGHPSRIPEGLTKSLRAQAGRGTGIPC